MFFHPYCIIINYIYLFYDGCELTLFLSSTCFFFSSVVFVTKFSVTKLQILLLYSTVFTAPLLSPLLLLPLVSSFPPLFSVTKLRTRRAYSLRLSRNKAAASSFAGDAGFGSLRSDCIATSMLVILYMGLHCDFNMSMHILPSLYTYVTVK